MPDKKLTDSEIVKALECCCENNNCNGCPLDYLIFSSECASKLAINSLDLINRLQAENERLKCCVKTEDEVRTIANATIQAGIKIIKAEAYKECIEKVKEEIYRQRHSRSLEASGERARIIKILDNLLKELVGEKDEK